MVKKLLFILFLFFSLAGFSQKTLQNLSAAPNPFTTVSKIAIKTSINQKVTLLVKNLLGKPVFKKQYNLTKGANKILFHSNNLQKGIYIYSIKSATEIVSKRFVIR